jgi:hypothetical protein
MTYFELKQRLQALKEKYETERTDELLLEIKETTKKLKDLSKAISCNTSDVWIRSIKRTERFLLVISIFILIIFVYIVLLKTIH